MMAYTSMVREMLSRARGGRHVGGEMLVAVLPVPVVPPIPAVLASKRMRAVSTLAEAAMVGKMGRVVSAVPPVHVRKCSPPCCPCSCCAGSPVLNALDRCLPSGDPWRPSPKAPATRCQTWPVPASGGAAESDRDHERERW